MLPRLALSLLAGVSLSLAFEPVAVPWLLPFALAAYALLTRGLPARLAWAPGLAFGVGFYFVHIWWMNEAIALQAWIALSITESLFYGLLGALAGWLHRLRAWPWWLAAAWTTIELLRSGWPLSGMPWGRLSFAVVDTPVAPALAYVGTTGLTFVLALVGFLMASVVVAPSTGRRLAAAGSLVGVAAVSLVPALVPFTLPVVGQSTVAAVQGGVPGAGNNVLYDPRGLTENHVEATVTLADRVAAGDAPQPDFVVWPENSTAVDPFVDPVVNAGIRRAVAAIDVPVLVGGLVDLGDSELLNQGIVWDPETGPGETYVKQNPVPYGEYIPWRDQMPQWFLTAGRLGEIGRDMQAGDRTAPLDLAGVPVAEAICFDIAYDGGLYAQQRNGAQLLVVQTSNASYIFTDQVDQQFAMTRLRAIESGRWLVVASTNGISGVISPDGTVVATAPRLGAAVLVEQVDLVDGLTPGVWWGRWSGGVFAAFTALGLALAVVGSRRSGTMGDGVPEPRRPEVPVPSGAGDQDRRQEESVERHPR